MSTAGTQQRPQSPEPAEPADWLPPIDSPQPTAETAAPNRSGARGPARGRVGTGRRAGAAPPPAGRGPLRRGPSAAARPPDRRARFLEVRDLRVHFPTDDGLVKSVDGLSFDLERGRTLGIVGESGSGKRVTSLAIMGLHRSTRAKITGEIWLDGEELRRRRRRSRTAAARPEDGDDLPGPAVAMHPYYTIGDQIVEAYRVHHNGVSKQAAREHAIEMLDRVGIPQPAKRVDDYPHQFSGGMRQRAMIAMALSCDPELLIADEPTTALDVTVQAQILDLIRDLQKEFGSAVIMITHDLGVVAEVADDILVMYAGRGVEHGTAEEIFTAPRAPVHLGSARLDAPAGPGALRAADPGQGRPAEPDQRAVPAARSTRAARTPQLTGGASARPSVPSCCEIGPGHVVACHLPPRTRRRIWDDEIEPTTGRRPDGAP